MVSSKCRLALNPTRQSDFATHPTKIHKKLKKKKKLKNPHLRATRAMEQMFQELMQRLLLSNFYNTKSNQYRYHTLAEASERLSQYIGQNTKLAQM